ncbi:unnamed protein product [Durusdinium trenchii]|uniref:Uncharacterized protein n=1 Tax=Durusdinium trenchii TaxID=1381693 RepID=A0ABP0QVI8_9DINO
MIQGASIKSTRSIVWDCFFGGFSACCADPLVSEFLCPPTWCAWFCGLLMLCAMTFDRQAFGRLPKLAKLELYLHNCKLGAEGGRRAGLHFGSSASNKLEKLGVFGLDLWLTAMQAVPIRSPIVSSIL